MPTVDVRPLTDLDRVDHLDEGNPLHAFTPMYVEMTRSGGMECHWFVASLDGVDVGVGFACPMPVAAGGLGAAVVNVRPEARRHGVGTALRAAVEATGSGVVPGFVYYVDDADDVARAAITAWGLAPAGRHTESVLQLRDVDRDAFASMIGRAAANGVTVQPLPSFEQIDDDAWVSLHAFVQDRFREAPDAADGGGLMPYETFRGIVLEPWMMATARQDGDLLGITFVAHRGADVNTFFTGVTEAARGRGVALAVKARQALAAADHGVERIYTQNMDGNEPILAANRRMGFVLDAAYVEVPVRVG